MRCFLTIGLALAISACAHSDKAEPAGPDFVNAAAIVPELSVEMRYTGYENFVGRPIEGYEAEICMLTRPAAEALADVQAELKPFGLGVKVYDCYRPARAVAQFADWARDLDDTSRKADYYPDVPKSELFERGYIAEKSGHSRGSTVDLTLIDLASGAPLDMGSGYDLFDPLSWPSDPRPDAKARANRALLANVMTKAGFRPLETEWWHFTLDNEPYPDTYFDFVIE